MGEFTDKAKGKVNEAVGNMKQDSDDAHTRREGAQQETKGEAQQVKGKAKGVVNKL